ncbi:dihydroxyacetone kinase subunit DhaL [Spongiactinospora sp. TRM90649]|uniref:dihydroxyacetone kinase subunit DhaL n=1 Tax=Spongiactinospora sp. TRM90649 TaxID=3031114 RepID=UPI0023F74802|nr:dihydroxyacetone kinase subunit DhaL [Spongiactinospora sp. TRM90649]MDF5755881.1 dihydroxyacetone kinase subunit DhaL [Spongiactinospora sp. TRM90649]
MDTAFFTDWIDEIARLVTAERDHLTELDAAIGDADHGANLDRGFTAARATLSARPPGTPGDALVLLGGALIRKVGGASGPLYGTLFRQAGKALGDAPRVTPADLAGALEAGLRAVRELGHAEDGDKTMVDALAPAVRALREAVGNGEGERAAFEAASRAAQEGASATIPLRARKGRASYLGERSVGHIDPGAVSSSLIMQALRVTADNP